MTYASAVAWPSRRASGRANHRYQFAQRSSPCGARLAAAGPHASGSGGCVSLPAVPAAAAPLDGAAYLLFNIKVKFVEQKKRKRGRPATGHTPVIALRLSAGEIQLIDELAAELKVDRSKAV